MKLRLYHRYSLVIVTLLLSAVAIVSGAAILAFGGLSERAEAASVRAMSESLRDQAIADGHDLAEMASRILANPLYKLDMRRVDDDVRALRKHMGILSVRVSDAQGRVLHDGTDSIADYGRRDRDAVTAEALRGRRAASLLSGDILSVAAPIQIGDRLLGAVHIDISLRDLFSNVDGLRTEMARISDESRRSLMVVVGFAALLFGAVGLLVGTLVARGLSQPIKMLSAMTRRIGQGDYDAEAPVDRSDEIGDLARDLRRMAGDLKQTGRMSQLATVGEVAVGVAHELNQPLNTIRMAADNALNGLAQADADDSYIRSKLDLISLLAGRMGEQIQRMCAVGRRDERRIAFDPMACICDAAALYAGRLETEGIELALDLPDLSADWAVLGLPHQLTQVFVNLIGNACDAIVERGDSPLGRVRSVRGRIAILLTADGKAREFRIVLADNGGGIPPEILDRVFDPFFTTKKVNRGTGLGLSISYGIVSGMGGRITVANDAAGAVFTINLPFADQAAVAAAE